MGTTRFLVVLLFALLGVALAAESVRSLIMVAS